uniref:N/A n=1 Tax=Ganoderma boninense TaxID=34458 RepID=A0A5K1K0C7_9APHY|nr:N/A [Ganoderma boninense]
MLSPFTRDETILVLNSLGIDIPTDTKLLDDILEKRLSDALAAAQYKDRLPEGMDLKLLELWHMMEHGESASAVNGRSLVEAVARHNLDEAQRLRADLQAGRNVQNALFVNPFVDLRQTMTDVARFLDLGVRWCVLQDEPGQESAILLRVRRLIGPTGHWFTCDSAHDPPLLSQFLAVLEVNEKLPVFVVLYRTIDQATGASGADWAILQSRSNPPHLGNGFHSMKATLLEQKMLLKILKANKSLVPPDYTVTRGRLEERFEVSILLPVGPLEYNALSKLNSNMGCAVCGKRASSRCSSCQSVSYCGAGRSPQPSIFASSLLSVARLPAQTTLSACQRADWAEHKPACHSLQDATWRTVRLRAGYPGMENCWFGLLNRHTSLADPVRNWFFLDDARPCVDVYGGRPFLVKMQLSPPGPVAAPGQIMLYDRRQTLLGFLREDVDPRAYVECAAEIQGPRGGLMGLKMYRWVRRTGDWELSVCLDRAPVVDAKW